MNLRDFQRVIYHQYSSELWAWDYERGLYIYIPDISITIVQDRSEDGRGRFELGGIEGYPYPSVISQKFELRYNGVPIMIDELIDVDGVYCPIPGLLDVTDLTISKSQYDFAKLVNRGTTKFEKYLSLGNITVTDEVDFKYR